VARKTFVQVVEADVFSVSEDGYTATVKLRDGQLLDVQVASPQLTVGTDTDEGLYGAGMNTCPVEGSPCLVLTSSYGQPYLLAYIYPFTATGYQGNRPVIKQGDIKLNTRAGCFLDILASGIAQIGATDIAKTVYLPEDDSVRTIAKNFLVSTGLGDMSWSVDDKTRKGSFRIQARSGTAEDAPAGTLSLGDNPGGNLVELRTTSGGGASFAIDQKGNVRTDAGKDSTCNAPSGVIRQDARKIYLNSGASFAPNPLGGAPLGGPVGSFKPPFPNNFFQLPAVPLPPGSPSAIFQFPKPGTIPTSLGLPDPKRILDQAQSVIPSVPLPPALPSPPGR
jgi:hypothetical protein